MYRLPCPCRDFALKLQSDCNLKHNDGIRIDYAKFLLGSCAISDPVPVRTFFQRWKFCWIYSFDILHTVDGYSQTVLIDRNLVN